MMTIRCSLLSGNDYTSREGVQLSAQTVALHLLEGDEMIETEAEANCRRDVFTLR